MGCRKLIGSPFDLRPEGDSMKGSYLTILIVLFVMLALVTAILLAWPVISYFASDTFG